MSGGKGASTPEVPAEFKQASLEMVDLGREQLDLSREQYEYVKNNISPKIMEWQERAANSQQEISDFALAQAKESWGRFKDGDKFRNILEADAYNFLDMSEEDAQLYVDKHLQKAERKYDVEKDVDFQGDIKKLEEQRDAALAKFKEDHGGTGVEVRSLDEWAHDIWEGKKASGVTDQNYPQWKDSFNSRHKKTLGALYGEWAAKQKAKHGEDYQDSKEYKAGLQAIEDKYSGKIGSLRDEYTTEGIADLQAESEDLYDWRTGQLAAEERSSRRAANETAAAIAGMTEAQRMEAQALGVRPGTTRYAQAFGPSRLQAAGLASATANAARGTAREGKIQKVQNMANISAGYPSITQSAAGLALQGYGSAGDRIGQGFGQVVNAYGLPQRTAALGLQAMQSGISGLNSLYNNQLNAAQMSGGGSWTDSALGAVIGGIGAVAGSVISGGAAAPILLPALGGAITGGASGYMKSSKEYKKNKKPIDAVAVSKRAADDRVESWEYRDDAPPGAPDGKHVGAYAEDMKARHGIGNGKMLPLQDMIGLLHIANVGHAKRLAKLEKKAGLEA